MKLWLFEMEEMSPMRLLSRDIGDPIWPLRFCHVSRIAVTFGGIGKRS